MQFKNRKTKNYLKLKSLQRNNRCYICNRRLKKTGVYILSPKQRDVTAIKCIYCLTIYDPNFEVIAIGIPHIAGYA